MNKIVIWIGVLALLPCWCWAEELTGRDIALKMDAVDTSEDSKRTAIMVINRKGQKLVRKMESCNKKYGPDERGLIKFIEPPDVRGIMYLTWSYEDVERDAETPGKRSKTLMQYDNVDYNIGLSDALFEQGNLKR